MSKDGSAQRWVSRRSFLYNTAAVGGSLIAVATPLGRALAQAPAIVTADSRRIAVPYGVQAGDLSDGRAIVWSRADRPARMIVEWSRPPRASATPVASAGPHALDDTDYTAASRPDGSARPASDVFVARQLPGLVRPEERAANRSPASSARRPPTPHVRFVWSGDTVGQGWGINPDFGGMKIYEAMRRDRAGLLHPFRRHDLRRRPAVGDEGSAEDGGDLDEHRHAGQSARSPRRCRNSAATTSTTCWTRTCGGSMPKCRRSGSGTTTRSTNNWYWEKRMDADQRYKEKSVAVLAADGSRAFLEYMPDAPATRGIRDADVRQVLLRPRISTCSCSTCAAIAVRTPSTPERARSRHRDSSEPTRSRG